MKRELGYGSIRLHGETWGSVRQLGDGEYETTWQIDLRRDGCVSLERLSPVASASSDAELGIYFELEAAGEGALVARARTRTAGSGPEYWPATYQLLRRVDSQVGRIWKIEGKPRLWYSTFQRQREEILGSLDGRALARFLVLCVNRVAPFFMEGGQQSVSRVERELFLNGLSLLEASASSVVEMETVWDHLVELPGITYMEGAAVLDLVKTDALTALAASISAVAYGSSRWASLCAGKVFDAAYSLDHSMGYEGLEALSYEEDSLWYLSAMALVDPHSGATGTQELFLASRRAAANASGALNRLREAAAREG